MFCLALPWFSQGQAAAVSRDDLHDLRARIEQLRRDTESAEENRSEAADALKQSERAISEANRRLYQLDREHAEVNRSLEQLRAGSQAARVTITQHQQKLGQVLYQQYRSGQADAIKLLMNGQDPSEAARNLHYYAYVGRERARLIAELQQGLARLDTLTREQQQKQARLEAIRQERLAQRQQLEAQRLEKRRVMDKLAVQIQQQRREIASLERDEKRLTRLVENLSRVVARKKKTPVPEKTITAPAGALPKPVAPPPDAAVAGSAFGRLKGRLALPVQGELVHRFGTPREQGGTLWKGWFIRARPGQTVNAVAAGQVVFSDWLRGFGNLIIVDHGSGYMSLYSNNETLYKQVGDGVRSGEAIATVGNSGGNGDAGLYFELRYQSRAFDPMGWVAGK